MIYKITPIAKPRMTQADKWKKRACVMQYRAFKDEVRLKKVNFPLRGANIIFGIPMPSGWDKKKKLEMEGQPHQQKPDIDNLLKALFDAVFDEDSKVWDIRASKIWSKEGRIEILN